jgi:hypothetical protein
MTVPSYRLPPCRHTPVTCLSVSCLSIPLSPDCLWPVRPPSHRLFPNACLPACRSVIPPPVTLSSFLISPTAHPLVACPVPISPPVILTLTSVTKTKRMLSGQKKNPSYCESCHLAACLPDACHLRLSPCRLYTCRLPICSLPACPHVAQLPVT